MWIPIGSVEFHSMQHHHYLSCTTGKPKSMLLRDKPVNEPVSKETTLVQGPKESLLQLEEGGFLYVVSVCC